MDDAGFIQHQLPSHQQDRLKHKRVSAHGAQGGAAAKATASKMTTEETIQESNDGDGNDVQVR